MLDVLGLSNTVTAYLKIPLDKSTPNSRNKCNIDFANDVFSFISGSNIDLVAITFDVKNFFDTLDHKILKRQWKRVMSHSPNMPDDHYNIYRNITKFSFIEESAIFYHLKDKILIERDKIVKAKAVDNKRYLRNQRAVAYCDKDGLVDLRDKGLIKANKYLHFKQPSLGLRSKGIPQGSPISAVLANVYMLDFDKSANDYIDSIDGIYHRYSDDMVVVCPINYVNDVINHFHNIIKDAELTIQDDKTQIFEFKFDASHLRHNCQQRILKTNTLIDTTNFEYLGFQFDGKYTLLKNSSLSSYYRKMKRGIAVRKFYTRHNKTKTKGEIFRSKLYKRFTHIGASLKRIFTRHATLKDQFILSNKFDWGNFLSYALLAQRILPENKIKHQIRNHWKIFHQTLRE